MVPRRNGHATRGPGPGPQWANNFQEKHWNKKKGQYEIRWADEPRRKLPVGTVVRKRAAQPGKYWYDTQCALVFASSGRTFAFPTLTPD